MFSHTFLFYVLHLPVFGSGVPIFFSCTHLFLSLSVTKHKRNTYICIYVNTYIGKYWDTYNMLDQMYERLYRPKEEHILQCKCGARELAGMYVSTCKLCVSFLLPHLLGEPIDAPCRGWIGASFLSYQRKNTINPVQKT